VFLSFDFFFSESQTRISKFIFVAWWHNLASRSYFFHNWQQLVSRGREGFKEFVEVTALLFVE